MNRFVLKILAITSMFIDHLGVFVLFDSDVYLIFRMVGRLAFPIFAFFVAEGARKSRHPWHYLKRLGLFMVFVEGLFFTYHIFLGEPHIFFQDNVIVVLFLGLLLLLCLQEDNDIFRLLMIAVLVFSAFVQYPYTIYGLAIIVIFGRIEKRWMASLAFLALHVLLIEIPFFPYNLALYPWLQQIALLFLIPYWLYNGKKGHSSRTLLYVFYPVHLIFLWILAAIL